LRHGAHLTGTESHFSSQRKFTYIPYKGFFFFSLWGKNVSPPSSGVSLFFPLSSFDPKRLSFFQGERHYFFPLYPPFFPSGYPFLNINASSSPLEYYLRLKPRKGRLVFPGEGQSSFPRQALYFFFASESSEKTSLRPGPVKSLFFKGNFFLFFFFLFRTEGL